MMAVRSDVNERWQAVWSAVLYAWCWTRAAMGDLWRWLLGQVRDQPSGQRWQAHRAPAHGLVELAMLVAIVAVAVLAFAKLVLPAVMTAGAHAVEPLSGAGTGPTGTGG